MAYDDDQDWGSIFSDDEEPAAIPADPYSQNPQEDWSTIFQPEKQPAIPEQSPYQGDEPGWGKGAGWESLELGKAFKEGAAATGRMIDTSLKMPQRVIQDVSSRITGLPAPLDIKIDWSSVPSEKIAGLKRIQNVNELVEKFGSITSPGEAILSMLKIGGALEPDVEYNLRKQGKALEVQVAEDFVGTAPQMAMNMFAGLAAGLPGTVASSGLQVYGAAYERHAEKNKPLEAAALAFVDAIPQTAIESLSTLFLLGGVKAFKPLTKGKVMNKLAKSLNKKPVNWLKAKLDTTVGRIAGSIAGEGAEEYAQSLIEVGSDLIQMKMDGKEITEKALTDLFSQKHKEGKYAAIVGALWGGAAGGPMAIIDRHNPLKDANPKETPEEVKTRHDAADILEEAGRRMIDQGEQEMAEAEVVEVHPEVDIAGLEEGAPGAEVEIDPDALFDLEEEPLRYRVETVEGDKDADFYGDLKDKHVISVTDPKSKAFKATFVARKGKEDVDIARKEREFLAGQRDFEGFVDNWMANEQSRPSWADRRAQEAEITTDLGSAWDTAVRRDAITAYRELTKVKDLVVESEAVNEFKTWIDKEKGYSKIYGNDFMTQVSGKDLSTASRALKKIVEAFTNVPVMFVKLNEKAAADVGSDIHMHKGGKTQYSGAIVVVEGQEDPMTIVGTVFHEKGHELRANSPDLFQEAINWIYNNGDHEKIRKHLQHLKELYGNNKALAEEELVNKFWGDLAQREDYAVKLFKKLRTEDPKLYTKILNHIRDFLNEIRSFVAKGFGSKRYLNIVKDLDSAIDFFTDISIEEFKRGRSGRMEGLESRVIADRKTGNLGELMQNIEAKSIDSNTFFSKMNTFLFSGKNPKIQGKKLKASNVKNQLIAWAKAGEFKMAELNWSPVLEWLDEQKIVSAKEVQEFMEKNRVIVTATMLKEGGMSSEDVSEDLDRLEKSIDEIEARFDGKLLEYEAIGSGIEVPRAIAFQKDHHSEYRKFRLKDFSGIQDVMAYFTHRNEQDMMEGEKQISQSEMYELESLLNAVVGLSNGLAEGVGFAGGAAQYGPEQYQSLTTPGEVYDYAEVILNLDLPQERAARDKYYSFDKSYNDINKELNQLHAKVAVGEATPEEVTKKIEEKEKLTDEMMEAGRKLRTFYYDKGHYKGPVIGHIRMTDRQYKENKVLYIEEIQTDWQQRGRKKGFRGEELRYGSTVIYTPTGFSWKKTTNPEDATTEPGRLVTRNAVLHQLVRDKNGEVVGEGTTKIDALEKAGVDQEQMVPDTPFKPFAELALKQIARIAAESGFDYVAWTPPETHMKRYNLARYVDKVIYRKNYPTTAGAIPKTILSGYKNNTQIGSWEVDEENTLENYVGEKIAADLEAQVADGVYDRATVEVSEDMAIGNFEWAQNLYGELIPRLANKLFGKKAWGKARVRTFKIDPSEDTQYETRIYDQQGEEILNYSSLYNLLDNYEGESWDLVIKETQETIDQELKQGRKFFKEATPTDQALFADPDVYIDQDKVDFLEQQIKEMGYLKSVGATFSKLGEEDLDVLGFPVTDKMKAMVKKGQPLFNLEMPAKSIPVPVAGKGDTAALNIMNSLSNGNTVLEIDKEDYGTQDIAKSLGFNKDGNVYKFDERIPQDADIIAGMYQAAWHVDLKSKRSTAKLYGKISEQFSKQQRDGLGKEESAKYQKKLEKYLGKSYQTYRTAVDATEKGDFLPTKNVYLRKDPVSPRHKPSTYHFSSPSKTYGFTIDAWNAAQATDILDDIINGRWPGRTKYPKGFDSYTIKAIKRAGGARALVAKSTSRKSPVLHVDHGKYQYPEPGFRGSGKGRQLLIQLSSDVKSEGASNIGDSYYEALYSKREGYLRPHNDFWELPEWMNRMAHFMPDADVYVIRNLKEATQFLNMAEYDNVFFSVLDITKKFVKEIATEYKGEILAGGYLPDGSYYKGMKNVTWVKDLPEAAEKLGIEYKNGVDYRFFKNTKTIPRLEMSKGCLHKCAFCSQDRFLTVSSPEDIDQQISAYGSFDYEIVYLNDKTFGQAKNYPDLVGIKEKLQKANPNFKGFVIQSTATQYNKMSDEFLTNAGIVYVELGVETFNDKYLASLDKPHREKHIEEAAKKIRRLNQVFVPNVMVGLAGKNKDGSTWVESVASYNRTMSFLKRNTDIISHTNIGVLAAETGTRLHKQLDAVESDQDEHMMERSWIKNQQIHNRFFEQLSAFGEQQLDSPEVKAYVKKAISVNTEVKKAPRIRTEKARGNLVIRLEKLEGLAKQYEKEGMKADALKARVAADTVRAQVQDLGLDKKPAGVLESLEEIQKKDAQDMFRAAGIKYGDEVFEGPNHMQILIDNGRLDKLLFDDSFDNDLLVDGFVTQEGEFVTRGVAAKMIGKKDLKLYSEDFIKQKQWDFDKTKDIEKDPPLFDLVDYKEGSKQSESYHKSYFGIFDIAKKAKGMRKVRAYLENQDDIYGLPVTDELVKGIGNHADRLAKDKKRFNSFKRLVTIREGIADGSLDPRDPNVVKKMEKFEGFMPYTIRHTGDNFFIGENMRYGKFTDEVTLFDEGTDVARMTEKEFINPVTGLRDKIQKFYDKDGVRLIKAPIFSPDRDKRIKEIKAIVKKNVQYVDWYSRWRNFVFQFAKENDDIEVKRIAAISGMLGAGKSPQTQQKIWANTINMLSSGRKPRKVSKHDFDKMMDIWEGKYDKILSKTDDAGIKQIQETFGRKIGPYLAAAVDPSSPNVLVLDRHMPKGWGYNVLHAVGSQQGAFNMHPSIEHEIATDIFQVAKETGNTVAGVQAALWFDFRTPAADISDIVNIAQIEPGNYVPYVWHKKTFPEETTGIHFKKSKLGIGEFIVGADKSGKIKPNTYSMQDIGRRIAEGTEAWPYQPAVYMYTPESAKESYVKSGRKAYTFKFDPSELYDGIKDPYMYWDEARKQKKKAPGANLTNIFLKLVKMREQYNGVVVPNPHNPKDKWILAFDKAVIDDYPELTQIGISDVIESVETTPQKVEDAVLFMKPRAKYFGKYMKSVNGIKKYEELSFKRYFPSISRFTGATSGMLEPGLSVQINGPLRSQRAYLAEVAIARGQREVYLMHEPRPDDSYPSWVNYSPGKLLKFKVKSEYNEDPARLIEELNKSGLEEFNVVESPGTNFLYIEQFVWDVEEVGRIADIIEKFAEPGFPHNDIKDVHSEILGSENLNEAVDAFREPIIEYWGIKKGQEVISNAIKEGKKFRGELRTGTYQKRIDRETDEIRKARGFAKLPGGKRLDIDQNLEIPEETKEVVDRIGRKDVSIIQKIMDATDYKKGTFVTGAIDRLNPLKMYAGEESDAYMLHRGLPGIQSSINAMLEHGKLTLDESGVLTTDTKDKGFLPWMRKLGNESEKFFYWVIAKRDQNREARDKKYKPMFTSEERAKLFKWTGEKSSSGHSWQSVNKEFQEFNQSVLDVGVKSGLLDPAMVRQFKDQFYIPFYRIFEDAESTAEFIKAPVNTKKIIAAQIKKLKGSRRQMGDPVENILTNWSHLLKQSMTNAARKAAFKLLDNPDIVTETGEPAVEEVPWKDTVIFKPGGKRRNDYGGADTATFIYQKENIEVLGFKDNGKTRFFKVNDPELFQSLSLVPSMRMPKWLSMILGAPKALLTFGATITPSFVVANTTRDTMHTFTISDHFIPFWDTMRGFAKSLAKDQDYVEYMASGNAFVGSYIKADRPEVFAKFAKKIVKKEGQGAIGRILDTPRKIFSFWETITEASENAARLALYSNLRKAGKSKLEASFAARDIMDFQKKGSAPVVQYLTATVPFLNARIQGLHRMGTAAAKNPGMYMFKGAMVAAASLALWAAYKDDDRYKELEDWEKFAYYHFWIGDKHFRIPKPFETGVIWSSSFTAAADVMSGNNEVDHITSYIGAALLDTFAMNPLPQASKPILEQYFNKTFFTGRAIVPEGFKYREPGDRYYPWDHESAVVVGKMLGVSPRRVQSLVRGYLAGLGTGIMGGADMMVRQFGEFPERPTTDIGSYPMIGRFVKKGPTRYTRYQSKFYDAMEDLNQLNRKIQVARESGEFKQAAEMTRLNRKKLQAFGRAKAVRRKLNQNRKNVNQIWKDRTMTGDAKKKRLDVLAEERNKAVREFWDWYLENV